MLEYFYVRSNQQDAGLFEHLSIDKQLEVHTVGVFNMWILEAQWIDSIHNVCTVVY